MTSVLFTLTRSPPASASGSSSPSRSRPAAERSRCRCSPRPIARLGLGLGLGSGLANPDPNPSPNPNPNQVGGFLNRVLNKNTVVIGGGELHPHPHPRPHPSPHPHPHPRPHPHPHPHPHAGQVRTYPDGRADLHVLPVLPLYLPYISPMSRLYLPSLSQVLECAVRRAWSQGVGGGVPQLQWAKVRLLPTASAAHALRLGAALAGIMGVV